MKPAIRAQDEVIVGAREEDLALGRARPLRDERDLHVPTARRAIRLSPGANAASTCWTMTMPARSAAGSLPRISARAKGPPVDGPDHDQRMQSRFPGSTGRQGR